MPQVKGDDEAYEDRLVILEELGIDELHPVWLTPA